MSKTHILALSSSRSADGGYLEKAAPMIERFLGNRTLKIAFIPFASVDNDFEEYASLVKEGLGGLLHHIEVVSGKNAKSVIEESDVVMVGGGNTFKLLHDLYRLDLLDTIRERVLSGTPYIGW